MTDFIGIDTATLLKDISRVNKKLARLVDLVPDAVVDAVNPYIVEVMKRYDSYKPITRKRAYGRSFQTAKQRRWFFWALDNGTLQLPYKRTQGMRNAWRVEDKGRNAFIVNETEAAWWTMSDSQARLHTLMGWQTVSSRLRLDSTRKGIVRAAITGTRKAIKQVGFR